MVIEHTHFCLRMPTMNAHINELSTPLLIMALVTIGVLLLLSIETVEIYTI